MSIKKFMACFLTVIMIAVFCIPSFALEDDSLYKEISTTTEHNGDIFNWTFPYSDTYFTGPDKEFRQDLARTSIGLSGASIRDLARPDNEGHTIDEYLRDAGFNDVDTSSYLLPRETDSVSFGLGHKKIGDSTLIAVGVCSANYGKEWAGNVRVGNETDHVGFRIAADKLKKYLKDYEKQHGITGKKMLWITGFSRGAAIGNLVSGDLMHDGGYNKLFGYFFATPRNTKAPVHYGNIFNIIIKDDFVPMAPLAEWGYERNGTDLYTFSPSSDTEIGAQVEALDISSKKMIGVSYYNSQSVNLAFRTIVNYMYELFETSAEYTENLQDLLVEMIDNGISDNLIDDFLKVLSKLTFKNQKKEEALNGLTDYLSYLANDYVLRGYPEERGHMGWNSDISFSENLEREHTILRYTVWMMADITPEQLFSTDMTFTKVIISTDAKLEVYDRYGLLETFDEKLESNTLPERPIGNTSYVDVFRNGEQLVINVPYDAEIRLVFTPKHPETAYLLTYNCSCDHACFSNKHMGIMSLNSSPRTITFASKYKNGYMVKSEKGLEFISPKLDGLLSTNDLVAMENNGIKTTSIFSLINILLSFIVMILLATVTAIALAIIRRHKKAEKKALGIIISHGIFTAIFIIYALLIWKYCPGIYLLCSALDFLACISVSLLALRGYLMNKNRLALIAFIASIVIAVASIGIPILYIPFSIPLAIFIGLIYAAEFTAVYFLCFRKR